MSGARRAWAWGPSSRRSGRTRSATTSASSTPPPAPAPAIPHVRDHIPERTLTTWVLVDVSASMAFGTAERLKSDVAEGVALVIGRLAVRRAGRIGLLTCGSPDPQQMPPSAGRSALVHLRRALGEGRRRRRPRARGRARAGHAPDQPPRAGPQPRRGGQRLPRGSRRGRRRRGRATRGGAGVGAALAPRRPPRRARRRGLRPARGASCPTSATSRSWTPRRVSASRPTPPAPSCGAGSPPPSWAAATS